MANFFTSGPGKRDQAEAPTCTPPLKAAKSGSANRATRVFVGVHGGSCLLRASGLERALGDIMCSKNPERYESHTVGSRQLVVFYSGERMAADYGVHYLVGQRDKRLLGVPAQHCCAAKFPRAHEMMAALRRFDKLAGLPPCPASYRQVVALVLGRAEGTGASFDFHVDFPNGPPDLAEAYARHHACGALQPCCDGPGCC